MTANNNVYPQHRDLLYPVSNDNNAHPIRTKYVLLLLTTKYILPSQPLCTTFAYDV